MQERGEEKGIEGGSYIGSYCARELHKLGTVGMNFISHAEVAS